MFYGRGMSAVQQSFIAFLLATGVLLVLAPAHGAVPPPTSVIYVEADQAFRERASESSARKALDLYRELHAAHPEDPESGWKHAMACYFVGLRLTPADTDKERIFKEGREAGLASLKRSRDCAPCHFWTAINMALYGQTVGVLKMLFTLGDIQNHLRESARMDPGYVYGGAYRLLGTIEEKLPGILGGSSDRARDFYEKAIAQSPDEPLNRLFLARLLDREFSDRAGAITIALPGTSDSVLSPERVESLEARRELQEELRKWSHEPSRNPQ